MLILDLSFHFNQKVVPNAAARLVKLPVVRSACATLSVLYRDAKSSNPSLRSMCEALESGVTALSTAACTRASPVIVKLEPQSESYHDWFTGTLIIFRCDRLI